MPTLRNLGTKFALAAPGANTNIFSDLLAVAETASTMRVSVVLNTASVFNVTISSGGTTKTCGLNASTALNAGDLYTFSFACRSAYTYNFQVETDGIINYLCVEEVTGGVL